MARLFFSQKEDINNNTITFSDEDSKHMRVLRLKSGTNIIVIGSNQMEMEVEINSVGKLYVGNILRSTPLKTDSRTKIHLIQSVAKLDKNELIIQKSSELNVFEFIPVYTKNTDVKEISINKIARWDRISKEASIQSGRKTIMGITTPSELGVYLKMNGQDLKSKDSFSIVLYEQSVAKEYGAKNLIDLAKLKIKDLYILVGPEGGFTKEEINYLTEEYAFKCINFKGNILRTETASITIISIIQYLLGNL